MRHLLTALMLASCILASCVREAVPDSIAIMGSKTSWSLEYGAQHLDIGISSSRSDWTFDLGEGAGWINTTQYEDKLSLDWLVPSEANTALWGNPQGSVREGGKYVRKGSKTYFDPCPAGWRVPSPGSLIFLTESGGFTWATGDAEGVMVWSDLGGPAVVKLADVNGDGQVNLLDYEDGWHFWLDEHAGVRSYFPATTRYDGKYAMLMGSMVGLWGNYWYNAPSLDSNGDDAHRGCCLSYGIKEYGGSGPAEDYSVTISPLSNGSRADAYAVRCVKE